MPTTNVDGRLGLTCISVEGWEKSDSTAKVVVPLKLSWWVEGRETEEGGWGKAGKPLVELGNAR